MVALEVALEFAVLALVGLLLTRIGLADGMFRKRLADFVMNVSLPCMIARSLYSQSGDSLALLRIPLASLGALLLFFLGGQAAFLLLGGRRPERRDLAQSARFATIFGNFTFMGFPVVQSLYGDEGLFAFTLMTLPIRLVFYASPYFLLAPDGGRLPGKRELLRKLITPPTIAVAVGVLLYLGKLRPPGFVDRAVQALGGTASVLGMLLVGMGMSGLTVRTIWQRRRAGWIVLCRFLLTPLLLLLFLRLLPLSFLSSEVKHALFVYGAVPMPSLLTTFSVNLGRSEAACQEASAAVLVSTLLCVATLPLWIGLGQRLL